jgi:hypothetical protein
MRNVHFVFRLCGLMGETNAQDEPPREHTNDFGLPDHENLLGWDNRQGKIIPCIDADRKDVSM